MEARSGESEGMKLNKLKDCEKGIDRLDVVVSDEDHKKAGGCVDDVDDDEDCEKTDGHLDVVGGDQDSVLLWVPTGRRLISGLLGLNVVLLGAALVAGDAFHPAGLQHQEPEVFLLLLMGLSLVWMLWYLLWARKQPGLPPHTDHHAGGPTVTVVLMLFAGFSLLLCVFMMTHNILMKECRPSAKVLLPFIQTPFLSLQTYLLWAHSKDCIHKHRILTRSGLMVILCTDILLWLSAVTEDSVHMEIEMEREYKQHIFRAELDLDDGNATGCHCGRQPACSALRKGYEVLYPFNMEFSLLAGCMLYVMWKNVGRHTTGTHSGHSQKITLRIVRYGGVLLGPVLGLLVLISGVVIFVLYQVWVGQRGRRIKAFLLFYGFHLGVMPLMALCSLAGTVVYRRKERLQGRGRGKKEEGGSAKNPTRSLDVLLLVGSGLGQLSLSYFSLVAALALGPRGLLGSLDLSYSLLSLLELVLQNVFIIQGLQEHTHASLHTHSDQKRAEKETPEGSVGFKQVERRAEGGGVVEEAEGKAFLQGSSDAPVPPTGKPGHDTHRWSRRVIQEICAFLILSNIMLWVIPAFGAHPQFESGVGKQFYGFSVWFVFVNLGQPLTVFYRMHSVGALMELLISA
ncbi:proton channel OTOP3-like isoform X1 [Colossoma macropomum]|uniref:proton channel OTOP3-like isoform X1 n=1 Tax=Colossoma macropomum TaxID=42526 RepID=UPI0018640F4B|nr:proton channel OTOP3-like isoform X1 [Colossoma macropomum]